MNPLRQLETSGQAVRFDYIRRSLMTGGQLQRMVDQDGLRGVTANPVIFEKAITGSTDDTDARKRLVRDHSLDRQAIDDAQRATGITASLCDATADTTATSASRCFCYEDYFDAMPSTGYETPLYDRPQGDATLCERADGVKDCWRILTPVLDVWQALKPREFPNDAAGRWDQRQPMTRWPRTVANETSAVSTVAFDASAKR